MKLVNFELEKPLKTISLSALGHSWDLHNFADFRAFHFDAVNNLAILEWAIPKDTSEPNPWGSPGNNARGCRLIFKKINFLKFVESQNDMPLEEGLTLEGISKVDPTEKDYRYREQWSTDNFRILFTFHNERTIEIGSETVVFEAS